MVHQNHQEEFVTALTEHQGRLASYIRTLVVDVDVAKDVLQETNLVLWRKAEEFQPGTNFGAWACKIAYFQILARRRDQGRERLLFNDELVGKLAATAENCNETFEERQQAMRDCLKKLDPQPREVVQAKYHFSLSIAELAERFGRSQTAIKKILFRTRRSLLECIERTLSEEQSR